MKKRRTVKIEIPENLAHAALERLGDSLLESCRVWYSTNTALIGDLEEDFNIELREEKDD